MTQFEWIVSKTQKIINGSEDVGQRECLYSARGNENKFSCYAEQCGGSICSHPISQYISTGNDTSTSKRHPCWLLNYSLKLRYRINMNVHQWVNEWRNVYTYRGEYSSSEQEKIIDYIVELHSRVSTNQKYNLRYMATCFLSAGNLVRQERTLLKD